MVMHLFMTLFMTFFFFQSSEQETKGLPSKKGIVQAVVGQGYHRKIVLASQSTQNTIYRWGMGLEMCMCSSIMMLEK